MELKISGIMPDIFWLGRGLCYITTLNFVYMQHIIDCFKNGKLIKVKDRNFLIYSLADHEPATSFELVNDTVEELSKLADFSEADIILGEEDRGGFLAALMAYKHKKPFTLVKWNPSGYEGQHTVEFRNAYTEGKMYLSGVAAGQKVIIVEDMVDSGGTLIALIELCRKAGLEIIGVMAVAEKAEFKGIERIETETGVKVKHLVTFSSSGEKPEVVWSRS